MSTQVDEQLERIEQAKNKIAGVFRERFPTIPSNAKLGDLIPYAESIANPKLQETTISPSIVETIAYPDTENGYVGFSKVTVNPITAQERIVTPTKETQEITPTNGFSAIKKVTVKPIPDNYIYIQNGDALAGVVIGANALPTENIDKTALYLVGGKYYKWYYRGTWVFNDTLPHFVYDSYYEETIPCSGYVYDDWGGYGKFTGIVFHSDGHNLNKICIINADYGIEADWYYANSGFAQEYAHKTITFTELPDNIPLFTAWLEANATNTNTEQGWYVYCNATGADALPSQVVGGAKFVGKNGVVEEGTMPTTGLTAPAFTVEADDEEGELAITATVTQPEGYTKGGSLFNSTYPKLTVSGDTATMSCGGASISRKVGASIATCNIKVKFTTNAGNTLTSATTFSNGAVSVFNSHTKSGEFTISNVICGSALSINTTSMCSLYWSGSQQFQSSSYGGTITVPATAGTYTVEVGVLDD